jgi:OOP family OmpA-OmpF porin
MKSRISAVVSATLCAVGVSTAGTAVAQQSTPPPARDSFNMPYQSGFWGTAGLSFGRAKLHAPCPAGAACDLRDNTSWRAFVGGKFNNIIGGEVGLMDLGDYGRGGGQTTARGLDLTLVAGVPLPVGPNSSIYGKLGAAYIRTNVSGPTGLTEGKESGWGPRVGIGAQFGFTQNWAVRFDADRYRVQFPGSNQNIDTYMIGAQYSFR